MRKHSLLALIFAIIFFEVAATSNYILITVLALLAGTFSGMTSLIWSIKK